MKLVILDRDGVINFDSDAYIKSPDEWKPIPGSLDAIAQLTQAGYQVAVATNQSGVGRGLFEMATLNAIHDKMHRAVGLAGGRIDAVFFCPHAQEANCSCRKPKPGLYEEICRRFHTSLKDIPCIGDSQRDLARRGGGRRPADAGAHRQGRNDPARGRAAARHAGVHAPGRGGEDVSQRMTPGVVLRSTLFALFLLVITPPYALVALLTFPFAPLTRYRVIIRLGAAPDRGSQRGSAAFATG